LLDPGRPGTCRPLLTAQAEVFLRSHHSGRGCNWGGCNWGGCNWGGCNWGGCNWGGCRRRRRPEQVIVAGQPRSIV
jgi:hypothetical protein